MTTIGGFVTSNRCHAYPGVSVASIGYETPYNDPGVSVASFYSSTNQKPDIQSFKKVPTNQIGV